MTTVRLLRLNAYPFAGSTSPCLRAGAAALIRTLQEPHELRDTDVPTFIVHLPDLYPLSSATHHRLGPPSSSLYFWPLFTFLPSPVCAVVIVILPLLPAFVLHPHSASISGYLFLYPIILALAFYAELPHLTHCL
jgi:hypothetical protein